LTKRVTSVNDISNSRSIIIITIIPPSSLITTIKECQHSARIYYWF
jgi:hypothetical protein